jgi:peptidoglycan-N-acetylglucosamine deacetylase
MYFTKTPALLKPLFSSLTWSIPTDKNEIFLTFDDGPTPQLTYWILDCLERYQAKATFFCVGANVEKYPDVYQAILNKGHSIANHTFNHLNGWKTETEAYINNVTQAAAFIDSKLFRPPYGKMTRSQSKILQNMGYQIIMWEVLSGDFDPKVSAEETVENVLKHTKRGSIIVLHDNEKMMDKIHYGLPKMLQALSEKGYVFGGLGEL